LETAVPRVGSYLGADFWGAVVASPPSLNQQLVNRLPPQLFQ